MRGTMWPSSTVGPFEPLIVKAGRSPRSRSLSPSQQHFLYFRPLPHWQGSFRSRPFIRLRVDNTSASKQLRKMLTPCPPTSTYRIVSAIYGSGALERGEPWVDCKIGRTDKDEQRAADAHDEACERGGEKSAGDLDRIMRPPLIRPRWPCATPGLAGLGAPRGAPSPIRARSAPIPPGDH